MSLIHDALKSMDAPQDAPRVLPRAPATPVRKRPAWVDAALAFVIVVGVGVGGWYVWQTQTQPRFDPNLSRSAAPQPVAAQPVVPAPLAAASAPVVDLSAPQAAVVATAATTGTTAPATSVPVAGGDAAAQGSPPVATPVAMPAAAVPAAPAQPVAATPVVAAAPAPATSQTAAGASPAAAPVASPAPRPAPVRQARVGRPAAPVEPPAAAPAVDETPIEVRFARLVSAMREGRSADAERELAALRERLPAGSLGLLRAQAWFDLRGGRDAAAASGYRTILERMPGDEEASINLASIQVRQNKPEEARATLDGALRLNPDSSALRAALGQFTPAARQ
ncbi:tetratricopeptide repeat protein [Paracidovorax sp. MALMAid1276]|uniref:tetratricopeptide repeat protein n=1 Tax=Paracidovorax sp. MALMAid1276 TaxID=3411631 RepID=UPI003B99F0A4